MLEETGLGQEGSGWGWGQTQRWDTCDHVPTLWLPVKHTQGPRGEAACERRGQAGRREGGPRESWAVRPPPGAPLCPPLPGRAGAARVSSCDATRAAPITRAVSTLLGPKRPETHRDSPQGPAQGPTQGAGRGLGRDQPQRGCRAALTTSALCPLTSPPLWAGLGGLSQPRAGVCCQRGWGLHTKGGGLQSGAPAVSSGSRGGWAPH